jgi:hypothetical protein
MPVITFDNFANGLDLRKGASVSDANRLRGLDNCYVTTGKTIRKRPGIIQEATIEAGTTGLRAAGGILNTFYASGSITHANPLFEAHKVTNPNDPATSIEKVWYADSFNGFLYVVVEYDNGDVVHHYLDDTSALTPWSASAALTAGGEIRPAVDNGLRYEITTGGVTANTAPAFPTTINATVTESESNYTAWTASSLKTLGKAYKPTVSNGYVFKATNAGASAGTEPTWPTTVGATVTEDDTTATAWAATTALSLGAIRRPTVANTYLYEVTTAGTTAGAQPTWPTTVGATVTDGSVTWTCRSRAAYECTTKPAYKCHGTEIYDPNCPQSKAVVKKASKIFAIGDEVVPFCKTNDPRNWTEPADAGFLGVGIQQSGAVNPTALGEYAGNLVVFFKDSAQVWQVDPDPANMKFVQGIDVGCPYPYGAANMAGDVFFASFDGVRSITTQATTGSLIDVDVGSPIDSLVSQVLTPSASVRAFYYRGGGQFWVLVDSTAYVYSFSRTSKISAWSRYTFNFQIDDVSELEGDLYIRSGDSVYRMDRDATSDAGEVFPLSIEFAFLDFQAPGVLKQVHSMDVVMVGSAEISHKYDAKNPDYQTASAGFDGDSRPGGLSPVELCSVGIAPVITNAKDEEFELHALTYYFDPLGAL